LTFLAIGDNEHGFSLRFSAAQSGAAIQLLISKAIAEVAPASVPGVMGIVSKVSSYIWPPTAKPWYPFLSKLAETGRPVNELTAMVVGLAVGSSVNYAQASVHVVSTYFEDKYEKERLEIFKLVRSDDPKSTETLRGYVREAMRLDPQFTGLWRSVVADATIPLGSGKSLKVQAGDRIWASFKNAHLNRDDFPDPETINPNRPKESYNLNGTGFHSCPGVDYAVQTITEMVKVVFSLKNVRRVQPLAGFKEVIDETVTNVFIRPNGTLSPWPGSLILAYDP